MVPVKAFSMAKGRLASVLADDAREALARRLATGVVSAAGSLPVYVVTDDDSVRLWAAALGATIIADPGRGLNAAAQHGVAQAVTDGFARVIIAHADLPNAVDLAWIAEFDGITLLPDRHGRGTNVIGLSVPSSFRFAYGEDSFVRHLIEARQTGQRVRIVRDLSLAWDVDVPADLSPDTLAGMSEHRREAENVVR